MSCVTVVNNDNNGDNKKGGPRAEEIDIITCFGK